MGKSLQHCINEQLIISSWQHHRAIRSIMGNSFPPPSLFYILDQKALKTMRRYFDIALLWLPGGFSMCGKESVKKYLLISDLFCC